jgi:CHY zinc finger
VEEGGPVFWIVEHQLIYDEDHNTALCNESSFLYKYCDFWKLICYFFFLFCSRWIAAQQKMPERKSEEGNEDGDNVPGRSPSFQDADKQVFGCEHYKRNCKLLAACCNKLFTCRFCHDKVSDHTMDR